jgi:hypothetical protein
VGDSAERRNLAPDNLGVRDLGYRQGTLSKDDHLNFYWAAKPRYRPNDHLRLSYKARSKLRCRKIWGSFSGATVANMEVE